MTSNLFHINQVVVLGNFDLDDLTVVKYHPVKCPRKNNISLSFPGRVTRSRFEATQVV